MTLEDQRSILTLLQKQLESQQFPNELKEMENRPMLRTVVPLVENGKDKVLVEICAMTYNDQIDIVQIYSTMLMETGPGLEVLRDQLNEWNLVTVAGAYGIYDQLNQLYHKHNVGLDARESLEDKTEHAFLGFCLCLDEMSRRMEEAVKLSQGKG